MSEPKKHPRLGSLVNAALVVLAFSLLGLVIWQNKVKIREVFSQPLDLKLLALALAVYFVGMICTFVRWFSLVRVIEPKFKFSETVLLGLIGMVFNLVIPGAVGGDLHQGGLSGPNANQKDASDRLDGDRSESSVCSGSSSWPQSRVGSPGGWRPPRSAS